MTSKQIEHALVFPGAVFDYRKFLVVPNVSWGFLNHEADLLAVTKSGVVHEIEIKISKSDLKRDFSKPHAHRSKQVRYLWYAGPKKLEAAFLEYVPEHCGIILVHDQDELGLRRRISKHPHVGMVLRTPQANKLAKTPLSTLDMYKIARLGVMRYWTRREFSAQWEQEMLQKVEAGIAAHENQEEENDQTSA